MKTNEVSRLKELTNSNLIVRQDQLELSAEINALKKKKNAVVLAHFYQEPQIQ